MKKTQTLLKHVCIKKPCCQIIADIYFSYCISGQIKSQFEFVSEFVSGEDTPGAEDVVQKPEFCPA